MELINKLKTVKKKWICLSIGLIAVIILGGVAAAVVHERFEGDNNSQTYQAYYDLLSIENTDNMKLTSEQAKVILPLVEQLSKTTDEQGQADIIKNIYSNLTSQQYYSLLSDNKSSDNGKVAKGGHGKNGRKDRFEGTRGAANVSASEAVVVKMLKDISAQ